METPFFIARLECFDSANQCVETNTYHTTRWGADDGLSKHMLDTPGVSEWVQDKSGGYSGRGFGYVDYYASVVTAQLTD